MIVDTLLQKIADIDVAIDRIEAMARDEKARLLVQRATLVAAKRDLTPKSEQIITDLVNLGLLREG